MAAATLALAIAAAGFLVFRPAPAGASLVLGFQQGETQQYLLTASLSSTVELAPGQVTSFQGSMSQTIEMHVAGVDPQGKVTLDLRIVEFSGQVDGRPLEPPRKDRFRMVVADNGQIVQTAAGLAYVSLDGEPGNAPCFPLLPDHPVSPGDRWETEHRQRLPGGVGHLNVHAWNELLDYDDSMGPRSAVLDSLISGTMDADFDHAALRKLTHTTGVPAGVRASTFGQVWVKQTVWLDAAGGGIVLGDAQAKFDMTMRVSGGRSAEDFRGHFNGEMHLQLERL